MKSEMLSDSIDIIDYVTYVNVRYDSIIYGDRHTDTQTKYCNPRAYARRGLIICRPEGTSIQFQKGEAEN